MSQASCAASGSRRVRCQDLEPPQGQQFCGIMTTGMVNICTTPPVAWFRKTCPGRVSWSDFMTVILSVVNLNWSIVLFTEALRFMTAAIRYLVGSPLSVALVMRPRRSPVSPAYLRRCPLDFFLFMVTSDTSCSGIP